MGCAQRNWELDGLGAGGGLVDQLDDLIERDQRVFVIIDGFAGFQAFGGLIAIDDAEDMDDDAGENTEEGSNNMRDENHQPFLLLAVNE